VGGSEKKNALTSLGSATTWILGKASGSSSQVAASTKILAIIPTLSHTIILEYSPNKPQLTPTIEGKSSGETMVVGLSFGGGISLITLIFQKAQMSPSAVANLSFILSQIIGQPPIAPLPKASAEPSQQVLTTESMIISTILMTPTISVAKTYGPRE